MQRVDLETILFYMSRKNGNKTMLEAKIKLAKQAGVSISVIDKVRARKPKPVTDFVLDKLIAVL